MRLKEVDTVLGKGFSLEHHVPIRRMAGAGLHVEFVVYACCGHLGTCVFDNDRRNR